MDDGYTPLPRAVIDLAGRMGGVESAIKDKVSHEKLMAVFNEARRDWFDRLGQTETHVRDLVEKLGAGNEKRLSDLQLNLPNIIGPMIKVAAVAAVAEQREAERKAREDVENKAKDAVLGVRLLLLGGGGVVVLIALFALKTLFNWSPF